MPLGRSIELQDGDMLKLLDDSVLKVHILPTKLFRVKENSNGTTTDWGIILRFHSTLSQVLEITNGKQLKMKTFVKQLGSWLRKEGYNWAASDVEASADGFRTMLRTLKSLKDTVPKLTFFVRNLVVGTFDV